MKKTFLLVSMLAVLSVINAEAQSIQEGINHLYADRFKSAVETFKKILAVNPNSIEATYWLGQTYLDMDDNDAARELYDKALLNNGNAPLLMVGRGHVYLLDLKPDLARQMFESALTLSRTRKGDDPDILNAIGRANVDAKKGNLEYAVQVLEQARDRDKKNADIALNLGNAYRKKDPGQGGGKAYENYKLATELDKNFAYPYVRIAKLFETQQNWDLVLENLNKAVEVDPSFSLAYYELFYYYFFKLNYDKATEYFNKYVASRPNEDKTEDDYLHSQLCWAKKDWDCAINKAESVKAAMGDRAKPKVFRQLAYSYSGKGDYAKAKANIDEFFVRTKDGPIPQDFSLKAEIYAATGASCDQLYNIYMQGAAIDTVLQSRLNFMNSAVEYFRKKDCKLQEADMRLAIFNERPNPNPAIVFNLAYGYYQAGNLIKADSLFSEYNKEFPDSIYGYFWRGRTNYALDTTMMEEPYATNMVMNYQKALDIAFTDKSRYKLTGAQSALLLLGYFNNIKSSRDSAIMYLNKGLEIDSTNAQLKNIKQIFDSQNNSKQAQPPARGGSKPVAKFRRPVSSEMRLV